MPLRLSILMVLATLCLGISAHAAPKVSSTKMGDFARISFAWDSPTSMKFSTNNSVVTLSFGKAVGADVGAVANRLRPYVRGITRTPDGTRIIVTMDKAYRVRQFLSGNTNGIDIIVRDDEPYSTEDVASIKAPDETASPILTTKKPAPPAPVIVAKKEPAKPVEPASNVYTTKDIEKKPEPLKEAVKAEPSPAKVVPKPEAPTVAAPVEQPVKPGPAPQKEPVKAEAEKEAPAKTASIAAIKGKAGELLVGSVKNAAAPTLEFAWTSRVALATFSRGNDIWAIFSQDAPISLARLISVLPKELMHAERLNLKGHTVLRFSAKNPVYPSAEQVKGTYHWRITFLPEPATKNAVEYTVQSDPKQGNFLLFKALDFSAPVAFYDPIFGDRWLIAPLYDDAHHIALPKHLTGSDIIETGQGIAVRTDDDTLSMRPTRGGIELRSKGTLPAQVRMPIIPGQKQLGYVPDAANDLVLAYHKYFSDIQDFAGSRARIARELAAADAETRPQKLHELAGVYIAEGFGPEAVKILNDLQKDYPEYYNKERLGIMHTAGYFMADRMPEAIQVLKDAKLDPLIAEVKLWQDVMTLFTPVSLTATLTAENTPAPTDTAEKKTPDATELAPKAPPPPIATLDLLKYQDSVLRFYPPRIRQKLSIIAADQYIQQKRYVNAVKLFDLLNTDNILKPIQPFAEYLYGRIAAEKNETKRALDVWKKLIDRDEDPYITARSEFASISMAYTQGELPLDDAIKRLEALRLDWRYDALEQEILRFLGQLYIDDKKYDMALRVWKELLNYYPGSADALELNIVMTDLFMQLYTQGLADDLPPLKSLALFYEFRDLIPVDTRGDAIVRALADRLASVDLVDRAIALLAHQIKFRTEGQERTELGTRLALLYIINNQPAEALQTLEATSYGNIPQKLANLRSQLSAQALHQAKQEEAALQAISNDHSARANRLRLDIVWTLEDWPNVVNIAEDTLALREDFTAPLTKHEQDVLLRLTLAYSFENNATQLQYLRDYYLNLFPSDSDNKSVFEYLTNYTKPLNAKDISVIAAQISGTESFITDLKASLKAGKLQDEIDSSAPTAKDAPAAATPTTPAPAN